MIKRLFSLFVTTLLVTSLGYAGAIQQQRQLQDFYGYYPGDPLPPVAQPDVSEPGTDGDVTGDLELYNTLTITGSGFGTHPDFGGAANGVANHLAKIWKDFEDETILSDGINQVENNAVLSWEVHDSSPRVSGSHYGVRFYNDFYSSTFARIAGLRRLQTQATGDWYFSFYVNVSSPAIGGKPWRLYWGDGTVGQHNVYMGAVAPYGGFTASSECPDCGGGGVGTALYSGAYTLDEWDRVEIYVRRDFPAEMSIYRNNVRTHCITEVAKAGCTNRIWLREIDSTRDMLWGHMIENAGGLEGGNYKYDDIYATYTMANVKFCDQPTWAEVTASEDTICETQIPLSWSHNEIQVAYNPGLLGEDIYAYVITNESTPSNLIVNQTGILVAGTPPGGGGGDPVTFVDDTFTDTDNTSLVNHTGEIGATWTEHPSSTGSGEQLVHTNRLRSTTAARWAYASGVPPGANPNYRVITDTRIVGNASTGFGGCGRMNTTTNDRYCARWNNSNGQWQIRKTLSGTDSVLGFWEEAVPATGTNKIVELRLEGTSLKLFIDEVERVSVTDSDITEAGRVGVHGLTQSSGHQIDRITAISIP